MGTLLGKLKRAVQTIRFLLNLRWKVASIIGSRRRAVSFNDRPAGCVEDPGSSRGLVRYPSDDDIDKRADAFIANFYKQLHFERQISLQLRYRTFDSSTSSPS